MLDCRKLGFGFFSFLDNESIIGQNLSFGVSTERPSNTNYTSKSYIMFKLKRKGYSGLLLCEVFLGGDRWDICEVASRKESGESYHQISVSILVLRSPAYIDLLLKSVNVLI